MMLCLRCDLSLLLTDFVKCIGNTAHSLLQCNGKPCNWPVHAAAHLSNKFVPGRQQRETLDHRLVEKAPVNDCALDNKALFAKLTRGFLVQSLCQNGWIGLAESDSGHLCEERLRQREADFLHGPLEESILDNNILNTLLRQLLAFVRNERRLQPLVAHENDGL